MNFSEDGSLLISGIMNIITSNWKSLLKSQIGGSNGKISLFRVSHSYNEITQDIPLNVLLESNIVCPLHNLFEMILTSLSPSLLPPPPPPSLPSFSIGGSSQTVCFSFFRSYPLGVQCSMLNYILNSILFFE
jgi:hypothetical protein